ncbi:MAG: phosphoesterase [Proteobacteria bacterium]|nr:phosphoesterase [Pseudomonadota bacterium]
MPVLRRAAIAACAALAAITAQAGGATAGPPPVGHVFLIVLENKDFEATFGSRSVAPFLARTLVGRGVLLREYYGTAHFSLPNYIAMVSGQAANVDTRADCETYADFVVTGYEDGQAVGRGCVYPAAVRTIADQLEEVGHTWRAYLEDMGNDPAREAATCGHPPANRTDLTQGAEPPSARVPAGDQYAARHNPFVYFRSILDSGRCASHVVRLEELQRDLEAERTTPDFAFVAPNLCHDGHDAPCVTGEPGGLASIDGFLRTWVPRILASPAYRHDGLLVITFDEGDGTAAPDGDRRVLRYAGAHCCNQRPGPNLGPYPYEERDDDSTSLILDFGGDRVGALLLSPFLTPGTESRTPFNHYALLRSLEDVFGARGHLGYAAGDGLVGFFDPEAGIRWRRTRR